MSECVWRYCVGLTLQVHECVFAVGSYGSMVFTVLLLDVLFVK